MYLTEHVNKEGVWGLKANTHTRRAKKKKKHAHAESIDWLVDLEKNLSNSDVLKI